MSNITEDIRSDLLDESNMFRIEFYKESEDAPIYSQMVEVKDIYNIDYNRLLPNEIQADLTKFFELAGKLIATAQENSIRPIKLVEDFNPEELSAHGDSVITWQVISRKPANMDIKAKSRPQRTPSFNHDLNNPEHPNKVIEVLSMPKDHEIEFSVWAKTASLANTQALWLENLLINHTWVFKIKGVERFHWERRGNDRMMLVGGQKIYERPLRFFVRLREFHTLAHPKISQLLFKLDIS